MKVILSPRALRELRDIRRRSRLDWGADQATRYHQRIWVRLHQLENHPYIGQIRDDLGGTRQLVAGHHLALYRVEEDRIVVQRIVHERMRVQIADLESPSFEMEGE
jgi:toxin ParE1/3/4